MPSKSVSGILLNDISDHLHVFIVYDRSYRIAHGTTSNRKHVRIRTEVSLNALTKNKTKNDLAEESWENLLTDNDVNGAYNKFLNVFQDLYDKTFPVRVVEKNLSIIMNAHG